MNMNAKSNSERTAGAVRCIDMVGAADVESEICKKCSGTAIIDQWMHGPRSHTLYCWACAGTGRVRVNAPTDQDHGPLPAKEGHE
jgi:hypothetical protein